MERDNGDIYVVCGCFISTHTLTWSVTSRFVKHTKLLMISTHTLTWSVTYCSGVILPLSAISTHTLTWSVTMLFRTFTQRL